MCTDMSIIEDNFEQLDDLLECLRLIYEIYLTVFVIAVLVAPQVVPVLAFAGALTLLLVLLGSITPPVASDINDPLLPLNFFQQY